MIILAITVGFRSEKYNIGKQPWNHDFVWHRKWKLSWDVMTRFNENNKPYQPAIKMSDSIEVWEY